MNWINETCPICRNQAKEALPRMGDFLELACDECGRFRVSRSSQEELMHVDDRSIRDAALAKAKKNAGTGMPFIKGFEA